MPTRVDCRIVTVRCRYLVHCGSRRILHGDLVGTCAVSIARECAIPWAEIVTTGWVFLEEQ